MKISACIPVYEVARPHLAAVVDSVLAQRGDFEIEVILSDDSRSTEYSDVLKNYDARTVRYFRNPLNLGMVGNWNAAVRRSSGELVTVIGHDDVLEPNLFAAYLERFRADHDLVACACMSSFIDGEGKPLHRRLPVGHRSNIFVRQPVYTLSENEIAYLCLRNGNAIGEPSCVIYKRAAFEAIGGYDPDFRHAADADFNIRIAANGPVSIINRPLVRRRIHKQNLTLTNIAHGHVSSDRGRLLEKHAHRLYGSAVLARVRASTAVRSIYDLARALARRRWVAARIAASTIARTIDFAPKTYWMYVIEHLTNQNADAR
jgi:glycosyltransferase involved in cell wall biosynthesis